MIQLLIFAMIFISISMVAWLIVARGDQAWIYYKQKFTEIFGTNLHEMFLFVDTKKAWLYNSFAMLGVPIVVYVVSGTFFIALISGISVFFFPRLMYRFLASQRLKQFERELPDALTMISGSMRAGASLSIAIDAMVQETDGPISQEFSLLLREHRVGVPLDQAFENLGERVKSPDLLLVLSAARIARDVGGNLSEIFDRLADTLRQKSTMEGKIKALTSQGKLQGWVVGMLPLGMIAILFQMEGEAMRPLFSSVFGWGVLLVIGFLEILGLVMIKKIVSIDI